MSLYGMEISGCAPVVTCKLHRLSDRGMALCDDDDDDDRTEEIMNTQTLDFEVGWCWRDGQGLKPLVPSGLWR